MRVKIHVTDDGGKEYSGEIELNSNKSQAHETKQPKTEGPTPKSYSGTNGGIRFLIDQGFFSQPRAVKEVLDELQKEGHYSSLQTVDAALRKEFVKRMKILTRVKDGKVWKYVLRK